MKWPRFEIVRVVGWSIAPSGQTSGKFVQPPVVWYVQDRVAPCPSLFCGFNVSGKLKARRECEEANAEHDTWLLEVLR